MHPVYTRICVFLSFCLPLSGFAQGIVAIDDSLCVQQGENFFYNVLSNDSIPPGIQPIAFLTEPSACFGLEPNGQLYFLPDGGECCGEHLLHYRVENCQPPGKCFATIKIIIKCPKPECFLVNLSDFSTDSLGSGGAGNPHGQHCVSACENSVATYFIPFNPNNTYTWVVNGGTFTVGANPAEINVTWGAAGSGSISLVITDSNNETTLIEVCVDILVAPVASFTSSAACVCKNAPISFTNTSTGGSSYFWDFGDGNTSAMFQPTHQYAGSGTYTVTLTVTNSNYGPGGNPLCCCTDTMSLEVMVDSLSGPNIYCISTLCAGDSSKYWTDATNCSTYNWGVLDENGSPVPFTGQGNDTICVKWGTGPVGTITLDVTGCDDVYCSKPVSVQVPIIAPTVPVNGPVAVCENETATYTVPKWMSVVYNWQVTGGVILSGQGTHTITVQWGAAPGPGVINLNYYSPFLGGLPGHDSDNCGGSANLTVAIKPRFDVVGPMPAVACVNSSSTFFATASPFSNYTWTITPAATFTGQGTNVINVTWDAGPGTYTVMAEPFNMMVYCNKKVTRVIRVVELAPPDSISGTVKICPGSTQVYFGHSTQSGVGYSWTVTGGTPASYTGNPVSVTWNASGPYSLSLQLIGLNAPYCSSPAISLNLMPKLLNGPLAISGPPACINSVKNYSAGPAQDPDAVFQWTVSPASAGSVISGQGTPNVQVQWNNTPGPATLQLSVTLCGNSMSTSLPLLLVAAAIPVITQSGILCPGVPATLNAGGGYMSYSWSTGSLVQTTPITMGGIYIVTATDANGCTAVGTYQAVPLPGPVASISTGNQTVLCITPPNNNTVSISALTGTGYTFAWYCNGNLQSLPPTQSTFVHTNTNVVATFNYWVVVTDANGCTKQSNTIQVVQTDMCGGSGGCTPASYFLTYSSTNQTPNCNVVNFSVIKTTNVRVVGWDFGDPGGNANTGTLTSAVHTYSKAGCFLTTLTAKVPSTNLPGDSCTITRTRTVCVPLAADFSAVVNCQKVTFTDLSTFQSGQGPVNWQWSFGDSNSSTLQNPMHTYAAGGTYTVMLTVTNAGGCQAKITKTITVAGPPTPTVSLTPSPACVGQPVLCSATAANIITWGWNFGDGATNGSQTPSHTYLTAATYTVVLTVTDNMGCTGTVSSSITVNPAPAPAAITWSPSLTVCAGTPVTLTAPPGSGYMYLWSNNATTPSITITAAGTYSVVVTDANGCSMTPPPVTVTVLPLPVAAVAGPHFICDAGCVTLSAPTGYSYTYQWLENMSSPISGASAATLNVCDYNLQSPYSVVVTDANGCSATAAPHAVALAVSPAFAITVAPDSCEGTPATLTVVPTQSNVVYAWNTGATGTSITVTQAGTYTAVGADTLTGCSGSASATIHPLPDLCIVPTGCYKACDPDTICGPDGLAAYQWNLNGVPIAGATGQCLIVMQSGAYSLTGTTQFGCDLTSDSLILQVIPCGGCDQLTVSAEAAEAGKCCWRLSYNNPGNNLYGLVIHTNDADLLFDLGSLNPALSVFSIATNSISLVNSTLNAPLPLGAVTDFVTVCLNNVQNTPQQIVFDWYDFEFNVFCSDTLVFDCPAEPDCLYLQSDSIACKNGEYSLTITLCNPIDNPWSVGYIPLQPVSPAGAVLTPAAIDESANPIAPGECRTYTIALSGPNLEGQVFCFTLMAHDVEPGEVDTSKCCSLDTAYCIPIPDCNPCDEVGIERVAGVTPANSLPGTCCYSVTLYNHHAAGFFDGIDLCMLSPMTSMSINNGFGSGWITAYYSTSLIELNAAPPLGNTLPLGSFTLPDICVRTTDAPGQLLEIKWMQGDSVVCRDTVELSCTPPCGYISASEISCDPATGAWLFSGSIKNTSAYAMGEANVVFTAPVGLSSYNQNIPLGALLPGNAVPFNVTIGAPAQAGDSVCFTVALHALNDNAQHLHCCNFSDCIVLPDCAGLTAESIALYPNPSDGTCYLAIRSRIESSWTIRVFGARGGTVAQWEMAPLAGPSVVPLDFSGAQRGMYFLEIKTAGKTVVKKMLID